MLGLAGTAAHGGAGSARRRAGKNRGAQLLCSNIFEPILTAQNTNFHIRTRILAKIEVVEDKMIYNFIFDLELGLRRKMLSNSAKMMFIMQLD